MSHPHDARIDIVHPDVQAHLEELAGPRDPLLQALEDRADERGFPLIGRQSGQLLEVLARSIGARRVFELGSGFGYSAFFFARAGCEVVCTEHDQHELDDFEAIWTGHPMKSQVRYRMGDALAHLEADEGPHDIILVDINKAGYPRAWELAVPRLRKGGLLLADNVLWGGKVTRPAEDPSTEALQTYLRMATTDPRVQTTVLTLGDGLAMSVRL